MTELEDLNYQYFWTGLVHPINEQEILEYQNLKITVKKTLNFLNKIDEIVKSLSPSSSIKEKIVTEGPLKDLTASITNLFQNFDNFITEIDDFVELKNEYISYVEGEIEESQLDYNELENYSEEIFKTKDSLRNSFIDIAKEEFKYILSEEEKNILCDKCKKKADITEEKFKYSINEFPFHKYDDKYNMIKDLNYRIEENPGFLLSLDPLYKGNVFHSILYYIKYDNYKLSKVRENIIYFIKFLSLYYPDEYQILINQKNCEGDIPGQIFKRICTYKKHHHYPYILGLLGIETESSTQPKKKSPKIGENTRNYHQLQDKLFQYFHSSSSEGYCSVIRKCEECNQSVNIEKDFNFISKILLVDPEKEIILKMIKRIINLRIDTNNLFEIEGIEDGGRHSHYLNLFQNLLKDSEENFTIFSFNKKK